MLTKLRKAGTIIDKLCCGTACSKCKIQEPCSKYHGVNAHWSDEELDEALRLAGLTPDGEATAAETPAAETPDNVNSPKHYALPGGLEVIDVEVATMGKDMVQNHCICTALEYLLRHTRKNGAEDVEKARWWLNKWHELREEAHEA